MTKEQIGKMVKEYRLRKGVSTYLLTMKKGIHPNIPSTIENGKKGYSMDTLIKYLKAIDENVEIKDVFGGEDLKLKYND